MGYATTCTIVDVDPDNPPDPMERFKWLKSIAGAPKPCVCVVQDCTGRKGWYSHWGEIVGTQVQVLGAVGIITDGAVRDLEALRRMEMKVWSAHVVVSHGHIDVGRADVPVAVGGLTIHPGDILHADENGVVKVPHEVLAQLPDAIDEVVSREADTLRHLRTRGYDFEAHLRDIEH